MYSFLMPDAGEGTHESQLVQWYVKEGDQVAEFDPLFAMESDKATVDVSSPVNGIVHKIYVQEGELGIVGKPVLDIDTGDNHTDADKTNESKADLAADTSTSSSDSPSPAKNSDPITTPPASATVHDNSIDIRTLAVPRVRIFARQKGVDLYAVPGTGTNGKITMADVENYLANPTPVLPATTSLESCHNSSSNSCGTNIKGTNSTPVVEPVTLPAMVARREPLSNMRKATNRALMRSYSQAPHVTIMDRVDCSNLKSQHLELKALASERGIKLTYTHYIVKAACAMLQLHPHLNARIDEAAEEMQYYDSINIGVAMDTPNGLLVPVVHDADKLALFGVARKLADYGAKGLTGQLSRADMSGGSITITNVGGVATGGVWSTPIINNGEALIIGIGRIEDEFMPDANKQPVLTPMMKISFTFDHRVIDGVAAQKALNDFKRFIAYPHLLLGEG